MYFQLFFPHLSSWGPAGLHQALQDTIVVYCGVFIVWILLPKCLIA